jgi:hypothetical protein
VTTKIEEFVAVLGWDIDSSKLKEFNSQVKGIVDTFAKVAAAVVGATTALTAFAVVTNKQTSINARLAESIDLSAESLENWTFLLGAIDFNADKVIRTVKTLGDRIGQAASGIGDAATVKDAVAALGVEFENIKDLAPEEQLKAILQGSKDVENGQVAAAAATQLLGRQGAFLVGFIRDQKGSIEELLIEQAKYNLLTDQNRESAKAFIGLWDNVGAVADSAKAAFAAYLGDALAPLLEEFLKFVRENRDLIKIRIAEWAEKVGRFMSIVWRVLRSLLRTLSTVVDMLGGFEGVLALIASSTLIMGLLRIQKLIKDFGPALLAAARNGKLFMMALTGAKLLAAVGLWALLALAVNSLIRFFQGKDSLVGDIGDHIAEQAHRGVEALSEFLGFSKEEFDRWLVLLVEDIKDFLSEWWFLFIGFIPAIIGALAKIEWTELWESIKNAFNQVIQVIQDAFNSLVRWVLDSVIGGIIRAFQGLVPKIGQILGQIPGIGETLEGVAGTVTGALAGAGQTAGQAAQFFAPRPAVQAASPTAAQAAALNPLLRSFVHNVDRSQTRRQQVNNNTVNVNQRAGESDEVFARRSMEVIERAMATAARDHDKGILR